MNSVARPLDSTILSSQVFKNFIMRVTFLCIEFKKSIKKSVLGHPYIRVLTLSGFSYSVS